MVVRQADLLFGRKGAVAPTGVQEKPAKNQDKQSKGVPGLWHQEPTDEVAEKHHTLYGTRKKKHTRKHSRKKGGREGGWGFLMVNG